MSLKNQALKGVIWSAIERFSVQGIQFVLSFIIARQLIPSDYGLVAMLNVFMAIAQSFIDSGFSNALIQKQNRNQIDYSTVFYFNIVVGLIVYVLLILCAPLISSFYNQPILKKIIVWVGINLIISSFSTVQRAILTIRLDFKKQAIIALISVLISGGIAIYMAYNNYGVWTLVAQGLVSGLISVILLWGVTKWRPTFVFSVESFKQLFTFGSKILASGLLHTIYVNLYTLVIGKVYPVNQLGLYNRAHSIATYPSQNIVGMLNRVMYPILCRFQNDDQELSDRFLSFVRMTLFLVFPMMIGLVVIADPLIRLLLSDKWADCIPYLQILCIAYMWDPIMSFSNILINSKGRSDYYFKAELIKKLTAIVILCITIPLGLKVMCYGLIAYALADIIIITRYTQKVLPAITIGRYISILLPILLLSIVMGVIVYFFNLFIFESIYLKVFAGIIIGIISYLVLSLIFLKNTIKDLKAVLIR